MKKFILSIMIALTFVLPAHAAVYKVVSTEDTEVIKTILKEEVPKIEGFKYYSEGDYGIYFQGPLKSVIGNFFFYNYHLNQSPDIRINFIFIADEDGKTKVKSLLSMIENPKDPRYRKETVDICTNKQDKKVLYNLLETLEARINPDYTPSYKD